MGEQPINLFVKEIEKIEFIIYKQNRAFSKLFTMDYTLSGGVHQMITKKNLISMVAKSEGADMATTQNYHKALEKTIFDLLSSVSPDNDKNNPIVIKLFEGITLEGYFIPEHQKKVNYLKNKSIVATIESGVKIKANVTRNYTRKLNKTTNSES